MVKEKFDDKQILKDIFSKSLSKSKVEEGAAAASAAFSSLPREMAPGRTDSVDDVAGATTAGAGASNRRPAAFDRKHSNSNKLNKQKRNH